MFNEMIFDKKIDLAATVLESAITNAENMDNIMFMESVDDFYMESEKLDKIKEGTKKFFDTIITAIKEFFEKIQNAIKEKINNAKINKAVNDIKKSGIKDLHKIKVKGVNEKALKKYFEDAIKISADGTKKILKAKSTEEIDKYYREVEEKVERIERALEVEKINGEFIVDAYGDVLMSKTMESIRNLSSGTLENLGDLCEEHGMKVLKQEINARAEERKKRKEEKEKQEEEARLAAEKEKALKKEASLISRLTKKIGSALSTTQGKIIAGVVAAGAVAAGAVGVKKINDSRNDKKFYKDLDEDFDDDFDESVDDIIDSLFDDIDI